MEMLSSKLLFLSKTLNLAPALFSSAQGVPVNVSVASYLQLRKPADYSDIEFPIERNRPKAFEKVPQIQNKNQRHYKQPKQLHLIRGPELIHNNLEYGQYGIQAVYGGFLKHSHTEALRMTAIRNMDDKRMFAIHRIEQPWLPRTKKPTGSRMGGGKGNIRHFVYPIKAGRILLEMGGTISYEEIRARLKKIAIAMPMLCRIVSKEILENERKVEEYLESKNVNPFSFKKCAVNNYRGIKISLSHYDLEFDGRYR